MRYEHSRWHVRAVLLESCQGTKNVWSAHRHKLFRVSPEQLLMATITERVADDVIQKEFRTVSATDGQGFPKCLNVSRDLPLLPADKSVQPNPEERAERRDCFKKPGVQKPSHREALHNPATQKIRTFLTSVRQKKKKQR